MTTNFTFEQLEEWNNYDLIEQIISLQNKINNK
jgi:hypothetical protein